MWFGEPHPFPGKRFTYQTEQVGRTKLQRVIVCKVSIRIRVAKVHWVTRSDLSNENNDFFRLVRYFNIQVQKTKTNMERI